MAINKGSKQKGLVGLLDNIARGIVSPFVNVAGTLGEGLEFGSGLKQGLAKGQVPSLEGYARQYAPKVMSQQEFDMAKRDPVRFGLQRAADVGSIGLNFAGGGAPSLLKSLGLGMAAGTLSAVGGAQEGEDLFQAGLSGAGSGLLGGGATYGLGKAISGISSAGRKLRGAGQGLGEMGTLTPIQTSAKNNPFSDLSKQRNTLETIKKTFQKERIPLGTAEEMEAAARQILPEYAAQRSGLVQQAGVTIKPTSLKNLFLSDPKIAKAKASPDVQSIIDDLNTMINKGENVPLEFLDEIRGRVGRSAFKPTEGSRITAQDVDSALKQIYGKSNTFIKDSIKQKLGRKGLQAFETLNERIGAFATADKAKYWARLQQQQTGQKFGGSGILNTAAQILPDTRIQAQTSLGRGIQGLGGMIENLGQNPNVQKLGSTLQSPIAARLAGAGQMPQEQMDMQSQEMGDMQGMQQGQMFEVPQSQEITKAQALEYALQVTGGDMRTAMQLAPFFTKELTASQRDTNAKASAAINALNDVAALYDQATSAQAEYVPEILQGFVSKEAQQLANARTRFQEYLGRLQSGGAITKQEEERFVRLLPKATDNPETAQRSLQAIYSDLIQRIQ